MYRFLISRRWLTYLGLAIVFAIACVLLSRWQMARLDEAKANVDLVTRNYDAPPVPFTQAATEFAALPPDTPRRNGRPPILEFDRTHNPFRQAILTKPLDHVNGVVAIPDGPGLGIEINRDALEQYRLKD